MVLEYGSRILVGINDAATVPEPGPAALGICTLWEGKPVVGGFGWESGLHFSQGFDPNSLAVGIASSSGRIKPGWISRTPLKIM